MAFTDYTYHYRLPPSATLTDLTQVNPQGGDLTFSIEREDYRYRINLSSTMIATGSSYTALKALLDSDPCDEVEFVIKLSGTEVWYGQLNLKKAKWNPDTCRVEFSAEIKDGETCLRENWEEENNIFSYGSDVEAEPFFGTLTEVTCGPINNTEPVGTTGYFEIFVSGCLADLDAYNYKRLYIEEIIPGSSYNHYATWVTEQATVACSGGVPVSPPGDGWILLANDCGGSGNATWGRKPQVNYVGDQTGTSGLPYDQLYEVVGADIADNYDNGRLLSAILSGLTSGCGYTVKSDFFGINAPGTAPSNDAYTASAAVQDIIVYQKSDIKRPDATNPATVGYIKLKDLLDYLQAMFQVFWRIEDSGATLRLEHVSYFEGTNGDDLTVTAPTYIRNRNSFTYQQEGIAPRDEFKWMDDTLDLDFRGRPIVYPSGCVDTTQEPNTISVDEVFTDLGKAQGDPDDVLDSGFFFMAVDEVSGTYYVNREQGEISGDIVPNAHLSWANLHQNYHRWGRPVESGNLNNTDISFESYIRTKQQQEITVPYAGPDFFALDFTDKIKTEIGWGEVVNASYSARNCKLTLILNHD